MRNTSVLPGWSKSPFPKSQLNFLMDGSRSLTSPVSLHSSNKSKSRLKAVSRANKCPQATTVSSGDSPRQAWTQLSAPLIPINVLCTPPWSAHKPQLPLTHESLKAKPARLTCWVSKTQTAHHLSTFPSTLRPCVHTKRSP